MVVDAGDRKTKKSVCWAADFPRLMNSIMSNPCLEYRFPSARDGVWES